nr:hypothetical protein [Pseudomonas syringae pv. actinidiae]
MSSAIASRKLLVAAIASMAIVAPSAQAAFSLVEAPAQAPVASPPTPLTLERMSTSQMQVEVDRLNRELQSVRAQLSAAQADATTSRQELLAIRAQQERIQVGINSITVNFAFGHATFMPTASETEQLVTSARASSRVGITGFTDSLGSIAANQRVAKLRAEAAKMFLVQKGIDAHKITAEGRTGSYIASNATEEGRAANRRVVFEFIGK